MSWVLIIYLAGYTNYSYSGGPLATNFADRSRCEAAAAAIKVASQEGGKYVWHVCVETGQRP